MDLVIVQLDLTTPLPAAHVLSFGWRRAQETAPLLKTAAFDSESSHWRFKLRLSLVVISSSDRIVLHSVINDLW